MASSIKNMASSVHQRLLTKARESSRPFNELLHYFAIERFMYRLSQSPHADRFVLKGGLMFSVWRGPASRPTMDIDLSGRSDERFESITAVIRDACLADVVADGMSFNAETVEAGRIAEDAEYEGIRVRVQGSLGSARVSLQIDIGIGDVIVPRPNNVTYPAILDFPAPVLQGYTMESTIAEKFQAMVRFGILNSRMRDFYDIWLLARTFDFKGEILSEAVRKTFKNRNTPVEPGAAIFDPSFGKDENKNIQWKGFIRKAKLYDAPASFQEVIAVVKVFLEPLATSISKLQVFSKLWVAPGPWR